MEERATHRTNQEARDELAAHPARAGGTAMVRYLAAAAYRETMRNFFANPASGDRRVARHSRQVPHRLIKEVGMSPVGTPRTVARRDPPTLNARLLMGSGDRIALFALPFLLVGLTLNIAYPAVFDVGGPPVAGRVAALVVLAAGLAIWGWSVALLLANVPRGRLIVTGPYALMKHPLYTGVALLVIPSVGLLANTWLGVPVGCAMYVGSRTLAPAEESRMSAMFGAEWDRYRAAVKMPWL